MRAHPFPTPPSLLHLLALFILKGVTGRWFGGVWGCRANLAAIPPDSEELVFGNAVYHIKFDKRTHDSPFGFRYSFFLKDAVEDVPEYVVHWENFVRCVPLAPSPSSFPFPY